MTAKKQRIRRDRPLVIPVPCKKHRKYGGKRAPTSMCTICEIFYLQRRAAVQDVKAVLRLLDRYNAIEVEPDGTMKIKTPDWMNRGATTIANDSPDRVRHLDAVLTYDRVWKDHGYTAPPVRSDEANLDKEEDDDE